ncbi:MAG: hypothetical protein RR490_07935, partial [Niameybacter sp.]
MTERERILSVLNRKTPDRLPWCADLAYYINGLHTDNKYPAEYIDTHYDNGLQKMHRDLQIGFYLQGFFPYETITKNFETDIKKDGEFTIRTIKTPHGDLREITKYCKSSYSNAIVEHLVKDIEDFKKYCYCLENTIYEPRYDFVENRF